MNEFKKLLGDDLWGLVCEQDGQIQSVETITGLTAPGFARACFKLHFSGGKTLKGRRVKSIDRCNTVASLSSLLSKDHFSQVISHHGAALIEEWIPGPSLQQQDIDNEICFSAGAILGAMAATPGPFPTNTSDDYSVKCLINRLNKHLNYLTNSKVLGSSDARQLFETAKKYQPMTAEINLVHADFCAENIIISESGSLHIIDNESIRLGAPDSSLARCLCRWPMTTAQREALYNGYRQHRDLEYFLAHERFWAIWAITLSVYVRTKYQSPNNPLLDQFKQLAMGNYDILWPAL